MNSYPLLPRNFQSPHVLNIVLDFILKHGFRRGLRSRQKQERHHRPERRFPDTTL